MDVVLNIPQDEQRETHGEYHRKKFLFIFIALRRFVSQHRLAFIFLFCILSLIAVFFAFNKEFPASSHESLPLAVSEKSSGVIENPILDWSQYAEMVKDAMKFGLDNYMNYSMGYDELQPESRTGTNNLNVKSTIVDALSTLKLMGLDDYFEKLRDFYVEHFDPFTGESRSVFETNIRCLGGLLSAWHLSGEKDDGLLAKARDVGDMLLQAFNTISGVPVPRHTPWPKDEKKTKQEIINYINGEKTPSNIAEAGTLQLEFSDLSHATGDPKYRDAVMKAFFAFTHVGGEDGMYGAEIFDLDTGMTGGTHGISGGADSFYEYLLKMHLFLRHSSDVKDKELAEKLKKMFLESANTMLNSYVFYTKPNGYMLLFPPDGYHEWSHLSCFLGGMFSLSSMYLGDEMDAMTLERHKKAAAEITRTCFLMYNKTSTGLSPESIEPYDGMDIRIVNPMYILRPEAVESIFYLYRQTHNEMYRRWGLKIFLAILNNAKGPNGFNSLQDCQNNKSIDDNQPSWLFAETFKYLFLLFSPDEVLPLDKYVFNTEAHPIPIL